MKDVTKIYSLPYFIYQVLKLNHINSPKNYLHFQKQPWFWYQITYFFFGKITCFLDATWRRQPQRRTLEFVYVEEDPININTGSAEVLKLLPGVGEVTAANIIAARPFRHVADLRNVYGIGASKYAMLERLICV